MKTMVNEEIFKLKEDGTSRSGCFCKTPELIENYEKAIADITQTWECHHRMEAVYSRDELIKYGLYYDCEPHQLIFLTRADHNLLHHKGKHFSEEHKKKLSESNKGKHHSAESRKKMSEAHKGKKRKPHSEETKQKISAANKGKHWKFIDGKMVYY